MVRYGSAHPIPPHCTCTPPADATVDTQQCGVYRAVDCQPDRGLVRRTAGKHTVSCDGPRVPNADADANVVGWRLGNAVSSAIARALGAGDQARAEELMWHGLILAVLGPIVLLIAFLISGRFFLSLLGGTGEILELAFAYSAMLFGGGVTIWIMGVASSIFRGLGDMRYPARMMIVGSLIQVPLSGALVLGYLVLRSSAFWCGGIRHCDQCGYGGNYPTAPGER